jgi:hypothetical protein
MSAYDNPDIVLASTELPVCFQPVTSAGPLVTLNCTNASLTEVLRQIGRVAKGENKCWVSTEGFTDHTRVSINLKDADWEDALFLIGRQCDFAVCRDGNVYRTGEYGEQLFEVLANTD